MTAQVCEHLILDGQCISMMSCPTIPEGHPRIVRKKPIGSCSACWRGYRGLWAIKDGLFYLHKLEGEFELLGKEPLLADWFSGTLRVPRGRMLKYVHMGFESVFEEEVHIEIARGIAIESQIIQNSESVIGKQGKWFQRVTRLVKRLLQAKEK